MYKKLLTIVLSIISVIFLTIGILYSACPVVPFVKYQYYKDEKINDNDLIDYSYYYIFNLNGTYELYYVSIVYGREDIVFSKTCELDDMGLFELYNNKSSTTQLKSLYLFGKDSGKLYLENKRKLISGDSNYFKASFNPTFIFYIVSAGAAIATFVINSKEILTKIINKNINKDGK